MRTTSKSSAMRRLVLECATIAWRLCALTSDKENLTVMKSTTNADFEDGCSLSFQGMEISSLRKTECLTPPGYRSRIEFPLGRTFLTPCLHTTAYIHNFLIILDTSLLNIPPDLSIKMSEQIGEKGEISTVSGDTTDRIVAIHWLHLSRCYRSYEISNLKNSSSPI